LGFLKKHGPHVPIGSDLIQVRNGLHGQPKKEYAVVFPDYFYGQMNEAKHQPGIFALPERVVWDLLEATCDEIARNGFKKIVIINGHGGNPQMIRYFIQTRLENPETMPCISLNPGQILTMKRRWPPFGNPTLPVTSMPGKERLPRCCICDRDLVKMDSANNESGANQKRLAIPNVYTAIWWYASYPNHYAGEGAKATRELGQLGYRPFRRFFCCSIKSDQDRYENTSTSKGIFR